MKRCVLLICIAILAACCSNVCAYTLTFDDIPAGSNLQYYADQYGAYFSEGFVVADHNGSSWGSPHSDANVLAFNANSTYNALISFGGNQPYSVSSLSAYFSTDQGILIRMYGLRNDPVYGPVPVADRWIGDTGQSWDNTLVNLVAYDGGSFDYVVFEGPFSADSRLGFCVDDMTIEPVPEPSSILFLCGAMFCTAVVSVKRKRADVRL